MLNVGPLELLVVLAVALIVVGPERLPELARSVGRALRQFREVQDEVRDMVSSGMDDEMRETASEFRKAAGTAKRATDVRGAVRRAERSIREETTAPPPRPRPSGGRPSTPAPRDDGEANAPADPDAEDPPAEPLATEEPPAEPLATDDPPQP
ncbi:MAG TPA: twin-arginine translocase TatA/TatE family subunit [Actinomycetota bacterium]|nr:twin-arginine translocase TatA/TatE family subunit [Actinomycetota bacterium]